jgi:hypothetical protein
VAISFCDAAEHGALRAIERMTGAPIAVASGTPPVGQSNGGGRQPGGNPGRQGPRPGNGQGTGKPAGKPAWSKPRRRRGQGGRPSGMRAAA